jgi:uncharacterized membrane protein HdeD (DUF308 family)
MDDGDEPTMVLVSVSKLLFSSPSVCPSSSALLGRRPVALMVPVIVAPGILLLVLLVAVPEVVVASPVVTLTVSVVVVGAAVVATPVALAVVRFALEDWDSECDWARALVLVLSLEVVLCCR